VSQFEISAGVANESIENDDVAAIK
jgi:hypothetical protein